MTGTPEDRPRRPYAVDLDDLVEDARVPLEQQVAVQDTEPPALVSEAETQRSQVLRTIAQGG